MICFCSREVTAVPTPSIFLPLKPRQTDLHKHNSLEAYRSCMYKICRVLENHICIAQQEVRRGSHRYSGSPSIHICNLPKAQIFSSSCSVFCCYLGLYDVAAINRVSHWAEAAGGFSYFYLLLLVSPFFPL